MYRITRIARPLFLTLLASATHALAADANRPTNWQSKTSKDAMSDESTRSVWAVSTNDVQLEFPYNNQPVWARMVILQARTGPVVGVDTSAGQLWCERPCKVRVRFDERPAKEWDATRTDVAAGVSAYGFKRGAEFVHEVQSASRIRVEATYFKMGTRIFTFEPGKLPETFSRKP